MKKEYFVEIFVWLLILGFIIVGSSTIAYNLVIKPNLYSIEFKDVDGIIKGSPVRFMGIIVGHVRNLYYKEGKVYAQIIITKKGTKIPDGAIAKVEFTGLAGSKSIELMPPDILTQNTIGIISRDTMRIKDFLNTFRYMSEALGGIKNMINDFSPEGTTQVLDFVSHDVSLEPIDEMLNNWLILQHNFKDRMSDITSSQKKASDALSKMNVTVIKLKKNLKR